VVPIEAWGHSRDLVLAMRALIERRDAGKAA
jgi:hypothetical protein